MKPEKPIDEYRKLSQLLLKGLPEAEDEVIRERMDDLWRQMSPEERQDSDSWLDLKLYASKCPHPARKDHEWYMLRDEGLVCRACGVRQAQRDPI